MRRNGRSSISRHRSRGSFARARTRSAPVRFREGNRQSRAFHAIAISFRETTNRRLAIALFAGHFRIHPAVQRKLFPLPIDLPKVQTASRPWHGRLHFDGADLGRTLARYLHARSRIERGPWKSEPARGEDGARGPPRIQRMRGVFSASSDGGDRNADSHRTQALGSTVGATKTWIATGDQHNAGDGRQSGRERH